MVGGLVFFKIDQLEDYAEHVVSKSINKTAAHPGSNGLWGRSELGRMSVIIVDSSQEWSSKLGRLHRV